MCSNMDSTHSKLSKIPTRHIVFYSSTLGKFMVEVLASTRMALSAVTEYLTIPKNLRKEKKPPGAARVLTSQQSLEMMMEKEKE